MSKQIVVPYRSSYVHLCHVDRPDEDVWAMRNTDEFSVSTVSIEGKDTYRTDLRISWSLRDKFRIWLPDVLRNLFARVHVGLGSMHIYEPGGFMKEHLDAKRPDENGLPHIMTLVLSRQPGNLRVCGAKPNYPGTFGDAFYLVLFSLNCPHEVTQTRDTRVSLAFPVYGEYVGLRLRPVVPENLFSVVLERLERADLASADLRELQGWVKALDDDTATQLMFRIREAVDDYIADEEYRYARSDPPCAEIELTYVDADGRTCVVHGNPVAVPEGARNATARVSRGQQSLMRQLVQHVRDLRDLNAATVERDVETPPPIPADTSLPPLPFVVRLRGRYASVDMLMGVDLRVREFLVARGLDVQFVQWSVVPDVCYEFHSVCFLEIGPHRREGDPAHVWRTSVEFNDAGAFNADVTYAHSFLVVNF